MIGILNTGGEYSEFYAVNPETTSHTIFTGTGRKPKITYSKGGRVFINGEPQLKTNPKELWDNLLTRAISNSAIVSTLKASGLDPKLVTNATGEIMDLRKVNSEASLPELVAPPSKESKNLIKSLKIFKRHRRSSSC
ncbi:unnamed protein product [Enterobius vermicularis]|uniref:Plug domain-containing protein n=1 Tax=Enterobius vermicularis TaxID=51028 RepID=A0A0N4V8Z1_ENTVE|nr:unnamed protein product [Enterobius vermicularis]